MTLFDPYKIKSIRHLAFTSLADRRNILREVAFNVTRIPSRLVTFDMVTQGASAMSQDQVAALFLGDEAYAGARNFYRMEAKVREIFGLAHTCPTHNRHGSLKLLCATHASPGRLIGGNTAFPAEMVESFGASFFRLPLQGQTGDVDVEALARFLAEHAGRVPFLFIDASGEGFAPLTLDNLRAVRACADAAGVKLVLDASMITGTARWLRAQDPRHAGASIASLVRAYADVSHVLILDGGQDPMSNVGGILATNDEAEYEHHINLVVLFEGLHTYGGMAGRTMEVVAAGLAEMMSEDLVQWHGAQVQVLSDRLTEHGVPHRKGLHGVLLDARAFVPGTGDAAHTLAAALYLSAGIRCSLAGPMDTHRSAQDLTSQPVELPVLLPRRALQNTQVVEIADAIGAVWTQRPLLTPLLAANQAQYHHEARFEWLVPNLLPYEYDCEPYTIHAVEHVGLMTRAQREAAMKEAGYNTFLLKSADTTIDFLTDSGTAAQSVDQWMAYLDARETPAMSDAAMELEQTSQETYGYKHIIPTHQGRAAEHIMSQMFIQPGDYVPGNMYFTTTREHQELAGGTFVDVIVDQAHDPANPFLWKGNVDLAKMQALQDKARSENRRLAYLSFEFNVNLAGGQPVSMDNIREVYAWCRANGVPVFFDATRCTENAYFIQKNDPRYADTPIADILLEMFSYGDGATISCKKDQLTNLSGMLMFRDNEDWFRRAIRMLQIFEGPFASGGTSAGDMAAHAQGLREMVDDDYIRSRVEQTRYLGQLLMDAGIPIVQPVGGHAVFLDARAFLPHLDQDEFPAQALAARIFIETGVRTMERGNVSKGRDHKTGKNFRPKLELVRLTIPRRVYTADHMKMVADGIARLYESRHTIRGLRFTYEPEKLRFFQSRFEEV